MNSEPRELSRAERKLRLLVLAALAGGAWLARAVDPVSAGGWLPFRTSCGAVTGLPCLFCGGTRALHLLLRGDFAGAIYYNWLVFPLAFAAVAIALMFALELQLARPLVAWKTRVRVSPARLSAAFTVVLALWAMQIYLAVSQHKRELLNPAGPLYSVFVR